MKNKTFAANLSLLVVTALILAGCGAGPVTQSEAIQNIAKTERVAIPLNENVSGAKASTALNIYLVVDGSGSMADSPGGECHGDQKFNTKIDGAKWAVKELIKKTPKDANLGLYVFDDHGQREVIPLSPGNSNRFMKEIDNMSANGGTPLAEAIQFGTGQLINQYKKQLGYGEYRLVVVTDGQADDIPEAALNSIRYGIPIYAIGLCIGNDHPLKQYAFSYKAADSAQDLRAGLEATLSELPSFDPKEFIKASNGH